MEYSDARAAFTFRHLAVSPATGGLIGQYVIDNPKGYLIIKSLAVEVAAANNRKTKRFRQSLRAN